MTNSIAYSFTVNVSEGPSLVAADRVDVEAYERIEVDIPADNQAVLVNLSAGSGAHLLAITASAYDNLTYTVTDGRADVILDGPHLMIGAGIIALLDVAPGEISFTNAGGDDKSISILIGRNAIIL